METKKKSPFRQQIAIIHKQLQVLKLREYIYLYLCKIEGVTEDEACFISNLEGDSRLGENTNFTANDLRYINGRLEEIEKLTAEICSTVI